MSNFPLHQAAQIGDVDFILQHAGNTCPVDEINDKGWTPLVLAVFHAHRPCIEALLSAGANINYQNPKGTSILMYAKTNLLHTGNYELLDYLIQKGADIHLKDKVNNWTILDYILEKGDIHMHQYLTQKYL